MSVTISPQQMAGCSHLQVGGLARDPSGSAKASFAFERHFPVIISSKGHQNVSTSHKLQEIREKTRTGLNKVQALVCDGMGFFLVVLIEVLGSTI